MVLTYDTIFELLLREKSREELQQIDKEFFKGLREYIRDKRLILKSEQAKIDAFSYDEREKTARQLENVYRVLRELYERREKKIVNMALIKSRTGSDIVDTSTMFERELALFESAVKLFDSCRREMVNELVSSVEPDFETPKLEPEPKGAVVELPAAETPEVPVVRPKLVRMLSAVPKFVGPELEIYGPFDEDDVAALPEAVADVLVKKGRAEEIEG